jgi:hypothetical protein
MDEKSIAGHPRGAQATAIALEKIKIVQAVA